MKHFIYSALAALVAGSSLLASSHSGKNRASTTFYFKPCLTQAPFEATLTNASNWTIFPPGSSPCVGNNYVCTVVTPSNMNISTTSALVAAIHANGGDIPFYFVQTKRFFCLSR